MEPQSPLPVGGSTLASSSGPATPVLCQDVIDCIIGFSDKEMLFTSSLVCRDWAQHSQARLLRTISLGGRDRFDKFMTALPALSKKTPLMIRELSIYGSSVPWNNFVPLREEQLTLLLKLLPNLSCLTLDRIALSSDITQHRSNVPRRSLHRLELLDVTSEVPPRYFIRGIKAFVSHFESIDDIEIIINPLPNGAMERLAAAAIRADMSWPADLPSRLSPSSLRLKGTATIQLHFMRFFRMSSNRHALRKIDLDVLDPDIIAELELLLEDNAAHIEHLALTFDPHFLPTIGNEPEMFPHDALEWRIDASLLTHLRTIRLRYHVQLQNEWLTKSSPRRWTQLLYFLEHFSSTSVECIILDVHIICTSRYASPLTTDGRRRALALLSWPELGVALQNFKNLKKVHVRLRILGNIERSFAIKYLKLVAKGLDSLKAEGRAVFDWVYHNETERRCEEFRLAASLTCST